MSLIDDVAKKRFSRGRKFETNVGRNAFKKEMKEATIHSPSFSSLKDNLDTAQKLAEKWKPEIRKKGEKGITEGMEKRIYQEALRMDKTLTNTDKKALKAIIKNWGKEGAPDSGTSKTKSDAQIRAEKRAARVKADLNPDPTRGLPDFLNRDGASSFAGRPSFDRGPNPLSREAHNSTRNTGLGGSGGGIGASENSRFFGGSGGSIHNSTRNTGPGGSGGGLSSADSFRSQGPAGSGGGLGSSRLGGPSASSAPPSRLSLLK